MSRQIVNTVKNKVFFGNILDKFLFSNSATFIVVFLGPLLSIITFLAFSIIEESSRPELLSAIIVLDFLYTYCRDFNLAQSLKSICEPKGWKRRVYTPS